MLQLSSRGTTMLAGEPMKPGARGTGMHATDDISLLRAIAHNRDHQAFTELYERYQKRAFNAAFRILRNSALAYDAVQDAMLSIWRSAGTVQPKGDAEDWIMRIVTNKSVNLMCSRRRSAAREESVAVEQSKSPAAVAEVAEDSELIDTLRNEIDQLPDLERTLLTCSYCTSMSHREIAKLIGVSQPTVSNKIQQALKRLRTNLVRAGVASMVPLLSRETMFEAMTTGHECPPGMAEELQRAVRHKAQTVKAFSRRVAAAKPGGGLLLGTVAAIAALSIGVGWWMFNGESNAKQGAVPKSPNRAVPTEPLNDKQEPRAEAPLNKTWTFERGVPAGFLSEEHLWIWQPPDGHEPGKMVFPLPSKSGGYANVVLLPVSVPSRPVVVEAKANAVLKAETTLGFAWHTNEKATLANINKQTFAQINKSIWRYYFFNNFIVIIRDGKVAAVAEYSHPYPSNQIYFVGGNIAIESIQIRELRLEEIPEDIRDPKALLRETTKAKDHGEHVSP